VLSNLTTLEMEARFPSRKEVKEAYRKAAMKYHPDRLSADDPRRSQYEKKFGEATVACKALLSHLDTFSSSEND
jgi:DnaJ-class molecular chaperone